MLGLGRIGSGLAEILWICCDPKARELFDKPDFVARLAKDATLFERSDLTAKASKLAGQPPTDTLEKGM